MLQRLVTKPRPKNSVNVVTLWRHLGHPVPLCASSPSATALAALMPCSSFLRSDQNPRPYETKISSPFLMPCGPDQTAMRTPMSPSSSAPAFGSVVTVVSFPSRRQRLNSKTALGRVATPRLSQSEGSQSAPGVSALLGASPARSRLQIVHEPCLVAILGRINANHFNRTVVISVPSRRRRGSR